MKKEEHVRPVIELSVIITHFNFDDLFIVDVFKNNIFINLFQSSTI